jgi:O-antigen/teichoic acid export membrane protein
VLINIHKLAFRYIVLLFVPIAFGATLLASRIMFWVYGNEFLGNDVYLTLGLLSFSSLFLFLNLISTNLLNAVFLEKRTMAVILFGILFNVLTNFYFIPKYGFVGAAFTTLLTEILLFFIFIAIIFRKIYKPDFKVFIRPLIAGSVMGFTVMNLLFINIIPLIAIGGAIYFAVLYAIGGFDENDRQIFRKLLVNARSINARSILKK